MNDVTLIIPAKHEPNALPLVLKEINAKILNVKIIVIIDKKDIETLEAAKKFDCEVIFQTKAGYGNAIIDGINHSQTKYSCIFYADGSTDPKYIDEMKFLIERDDLDLIFGSRYEKGAYSLDDDFITRFGNYFFTFLGNFFTKLNLSDILFTYIFGKTDSFKKMKLSCNDYCLCIEIPIKSKSLGLKYKTIPCIERKRLADKKKVKAFSDGLKILIYFFIQYLKSFNRK